MNDRQLRSFVLSAECRSFAEAASKSYISTTALIQQINSLESSIGFTLFERGNHGITLTKAGESFYRAAAEILDVYDSACTACREIEKEQGMELRIAYAGELFPSFVLRAYEEFCSDFPNASASFVPLPYNQHLAGLTDGTADVSIIAEPDKRFLNGLMFIRICDDTYSFCMRPSHPLAGRTAITAYDLKGVRVMCGNYYYLRYPFEVQLSTTSAELRCLKDEYDMTVRTHSLMSDEVFVIHSLWKEQYKSFLTVVPSDIPAGPIGVLCRKSFSPAVKKFTECLLRTSSEAGTHRP